jgi:predicted RecA/RadA family phage recombinase
MTTKFIAQGDVLDHVSGGVIASGAVVLIGALVGIATTAATASGQTIAVKVSGVWQVTKIGSQAWTIGQRVYWDAGNSRFTIVATGNTFAGVAYEAVGSGAGETTGKIRLNGTAPDAGSSFAQAANVAALTDGTTGTPDDPAEALEAVANPDLSAWNGSTDPSAAQATAINAAITALTNNQATIAAHIKDALDSLKAANQMAADA